MESATNDTPLPILFKVFKQIPLNPAQFCVRIHPISVRARSGARSVVRTAACLLCFVTFVAPVCLATQAERRGDVTKLAGEQTPSFFAWNQLVKSVDRAYKVDGARWYLMTSIGLGETLRDLPSGEAIFENICQNAILASREEDRWSGEREALFKQLQSQELDEAEYVARQRKMQRDGVARIKHYLILMHDTIVSLDPVQGPAVWDRIRSHVHQLRLGTEVTFRDFTEHDREFLEILRTFDDPVF